MVDFDNADIAMAVLGLLGAGLLICVGFEAVGFGEIAGPFSTILGAIGGMGSKDLLKKLVKSKQEPKPETS